MTKLQLSKENLKFSSAHFLIFNEHKAEKLHGHNYQVTLEVSADPKLLDQSGFLVNFTDLKKVVKAKLDQWDEHVLIPQKHPDIVISYDKSFSQNSLHIQFRNRHYVFPENEVVLLPITNTSVELLSQLLAQEIFQKLQPFGIVGLCLGVEETRGQGATSSVGNL